MEIWNQITSFLADNVNTVMILLGFFILGALFVLLYLEKKANKAYELKKQQEGENLLIEEASSDLDADALGIENNEIVEESVVLHQKDENIAKFTQNQNKDIEEILEQEQIEENASKNDEKETEKKEDVDVLHTYENVIKESDAMLEAMQSIIDDNIVEMENLEKQNIDATEDVCNKDKVNIVSKYKVLYDKVKKDWVVKKEGSTRATKRCKTKEEAIDFAKKCTIDSELGLTFHKKDGKFQKKAKQD